MPLQARESDMVRFSHPNLGKILGVRRSETVVQYLGVQYATLKDRFSRGELLSRLTDHDVEVDATKHGYFVPFACPILSNSLSTP